MITLQGMADNRLTIVYFFTNVFLGEIFFTPEIHDPLYGKKCCLINLEVWVT